MSRRWGATRLLAPIASLILFFAMAGGVAAQQAQPGSAGSSPAGTATPAATTGGNGTIKGNVTNLTKGGGSVAGLDLNLYIYKGQDQSGKKTAKAGPDGKFSFDGLDTGSDFTYLVHAQYQGADYATDPIVFPAGSTEQSTELEVFDSTSSDENIKVAATHYLLDVEPGSVYVSEIVIVTNSGDKTYVGSKEVHQGIKETLRFSIPQGAQQVEYGGGMLGARVFQDNGDLVDTFPLYPGDSQRIFRYVIPFSGDTASFVSKLTATTGKVNVLIPDTGVGITVSNLPNKSNQQIQDQRYILLSGDNLAAGTSLEFKLDHLPKGGSTGGALTQGMLPALAGGGVVLVVLIASVTIFFVRRRRGPSRAPATRGQGTAESGAHGAALGQAEVSSTLSISDIEAEEEILDAQKRELIAAIARLDDDYEAQRIGSEEYSRERAEKKRRLVQIVERQKGLAAMKEQR